MALYKGVSPTLMGAMPYEGIKFGTVARFGTWFPQRQGMVWWRWTMID
jgi:hypothetical protein